jgi:NADPH2:quinone reductase
MATTQAILVRQFGGPEVLEWATAEVAEPGTGEVIVRHTAVGVNFVDVYERTGLYPSALPFIPGREAAGVVVKVGKKVSGLTAGDRVAYVHGGAYCVERVVPAGRLVKIPSDVGDETAAAGLLKGLTAEFLLRRTYRVKRGDTVVIHAAAGGVGSIAVQWAKHLGARVIGIVGSASKAEIARGHGAEEVLLSTDDWVPAVRSLTGGKGVPVVYDSVGKDTFFKSLDVLSARGLMVTFGNASGPVPPVAPLELSKRGSLFLTRPTLVNYIATTRELATAAKGLFDVLGRGVVKIHIGRKYALADAASAHRDLESRVTTGSSILLPAG